MMLLTGGEGCLQSTAASVIGIGSDIGGSIRMPAFFNGVFGHKATTGLYVSRHGRVCVCVCVCVCWLFLLLVAKNSNGMKITADDDRCN